MGIQLTEFIRSEVLFPRLKKRGCMVVYDPEVRYKDLCQSMGSTSIRVVDASNSSVESRDAALQGLAELGKTKTKLEGLLVYVPARKPVTDEQKQADPFALYAECGAIFPEDDGDEFMNLCLRPSPISLRRSGASLKRILHLPLISSTLSAPADNGPNSERR